MNKYLKGLLVFGLIGLLGACSASEKSLLDNPYQVYKNAYMKTSGADSITSNNTMNLILDVEENVGRLTMKTDSSFEIMDRRGNPSMKFSSNEKMEGFMEDNMNFVGYYQDGVFYLDYGGYKVKDESLSINEIEKFNSIQNIFDENQIASIKGYDLSSQKVVEIKLNDEVITDYIDSILGDFLDVSNLKEVEGITVVTIENDFLVEDTTTINFSLTTSGIEAKGTLVNENKYSSIGSTVVAFEGDFSDFVDVDEYLYTDDETLKESALDTFKERLVSWLGYDVNKGVYSLVFNDNESYYWDFDNKLFTYINGKEKYVYDWKNDLGFHDKCQYDYEDEKSSGACEVMDIDNLKSAKDNFEIEIMICELDVNEIVEEE